MGWTFYDSSGRKLNTASTLIDNLDIDGATDIGAAIVDADLFIIDDGAGGTNRKTAASRLKTYIGSAATQAEMEAASSNTVFATPGRTHNHPGVAKVWAKVDMDGTMALDESYNCTSVADNGTGVGTITIATDFATSDYCAVASPIQGNAMFTSVDQPAVGSVKVYIRDSGASAADTKMGVALFGDQ